MRIALAGIEIQEKNDAAYQARAPSVLTSFYYAEGIEKSIRFRTWEATLRQATLRLADSGAYTFRSAARFGKSTGADVKLDDHLMRFLYWLRRFRGLLDYWFELDVGIAAGQPWVKAARESFARAGLADGLILAWHPAEHSWDDWIWMLDEARQPGRSGYVAIEGRDSLNNIPYVKHVRAAYERGVKVHAFKMTSIDDLRAIPFYSVDSTTWSTGATWGVKGLIDPSGWPHAMHTSGPGGAPPNPGTISARGRTIWKGRLPSRGGTRRCRTDELVATARAWMQTERSITDYWRGRGVDWEAATERRTA